MEHFLYVKIIPLGVFALKLLQCEGFCNSILALYLRLYSLHPQNSLSRKVQGRDAEQAAQNTSDMSFARFSDLKPAGQRIQVEFEIYVVRRFEAIIRPKPATLQRPWRKILDESYLGRGVISSQAVLSQQWKLYRTKSSNPVLFSLKQICDKNVPTSLYSSRRKHGKAVHREAPSSSLFSRCKTPQA